MTHCFRWIVLLKLLQAFNYGTQGSSVVKEEKKIIYDNWEKKSKTAVVFLKKKNIYKKEYIYICPRLFT